MPADEAVYSSFICKSVKIKGKIITLQIEDGSKSSNAFFEVFCRKEDAFSGVKRPLSKRPNIDFQTQLSLNAGQKYCRMPKEHTAILSTFIKLPFVIKIFVLSIGVRFTQVLLYLIKLSQYN